MHAGGIFFTVESPASDAAISDYLVDVGKLQMSVTNFTQLHSGLAGLGDFVDQMVR